MELNKVQIGNEEYSQPYDFSQSRADDSLEFQIIMPNDFDFNALSYLIQKNKIIFKSYSDEVTQVYTEYINLVKVYIDYNRVINYLDNDLQKPVYGNVITAVVKKKNEFDILTEVVEAQSEAIDYLLGLAE